MTAQTIRSRTAILSLIARNLLKSGARRPRLAHFTQIFSVFFMILLDQTEHPGRIHPHLITAHLAALYCAEKLLIMPGMKRSPPAAATRCGFGFG